MINSIIKSELSCSETLLSSEITLLTLDSVILLVFLRLIKIIFCPSNTIYYHLQIKGKTYAKKPFLAHKRQDEPC